MGHKTELRFYLLNNEEEKLCIVMHAVHCLKMDLHIVRSAEKL